MKNYVQAGDVLTLVAPYDLTGGAGLLVGLIFAVAAHSAPLGAAVEAKTSGVYDLTALAADAGAPGAAIYWDNANRRLTVTAAGNTKVGVLVAAKVNGDSTARVRLNGVF